MERIITFVLHSENHIFKAKNYLKNPYRVFPQTTPPEGSTTSLSAPIWMLQQAIIFIQYFCGPLK